LGILNIRQTSDPLLVAQMFEKFGEATFPKLIGEFALSMWCANTKTLLFARSIDGARPLYYKLGNEQIIWASSFARLVRCTQAELTVDQEYVNGYLKSLPPTDRTALLDVRPVPPNTLLRFQGGRFRQTTPLWNPDEVKPFSCRTDEEYEESCREHLKDAVRTRLRAKHPVFAELSGGLDSSSLVSLADKIRRSEIPSMPDLYTVSRIYTEAETCDERRFIRAVEDARGRESLYVHEHEERGTLDLDQPEFTGLPSPLHCFPGTYESYAALMKTYRSRILLTGIGGDHLFWSLRDGVPLLAEQLRQGNFREFHRDCQSWCLETNAPYIHLLARSLRMAVQEGTGLHSQIRSRQLRSLFAQISAGYFNEYQQLYITHPYTHRPLIEFCLALPFSQLIRGTIPRSIQRRALRGILPDKIANRKSKASGDETFMRLIRKEWKSIGDVRQWEVCKREIISPEVLSHDLNDMKLGFHQTSPLVIRVISLERWLRSLSRAHTTAAPASHPEKASIYQPDKLVAEMRHHALPN
jgi:asparagine synthase (glutamine-hydrolysing)